MTDTKFKTVVGREGGRAGAGEDDPAKFGCMVNPGTLSWPVGSGWAVRYCIFSMVGSQ